MKAGHIFACFMFVFASFQVITEVNALLHTYTKNATHLSNVHPTYPHTTYGVNTTTTYGVNATTYGVNATTHGVNATTHGVNATTHGVNATTHGVNVTYPHSYGYGYGHSVDLPSNMSQGVIAENLLDLNDSTLALLELQMDGLACPPGQIMDVEMEECVCDPKAYTVGLICPNGGVAVNLTSLLSCNTPCLYNVCSRNSTGNVTTGGGLNVTTGGNTTITVGDVNNSTTNGTIVTNTTVSQFNSTVVTTTTGLCPLNYTLNNNNVTCCPTGSRLSLDNTTCCNVDCVFSAVQCLSNQYQNPIGGCCPTYTCLNCTGNAVANRTDATQCICPGTLVSPPGVLNCMCPLPPNANMLTTVYPNGNDTSGCYTYTMCPNSASNLNCSSSSYTNCTNNVVVGANGLNYTCVTCSCASCSSASDNTSVATGLDSNNCTTYTPCSLTPQVDTQFCIRGDTWQCSNTTVIGLDGSNNTCYNCSCSPCVNVTSCDAGSYLDTSGSCSVCATCDEVPLSNLGSYYPNGTDSNNCTTYDFCRTSVVESEMCMRNRTWSCSNANVTSSNGTSYQCQDCNCVPCHTPVCLANQTLDTTGQCPVCKCLAAGEHCRKHPICYFLDTCGLGGTVPCCEDTPVLSEELYSTNGTLLACAVYDTCPQCQGLNFSDLLNMGWTDYFTNSTFVNTIRTLLASTTTTDNHDYESTGTYNNGYNGNNNGYNGNNNGYNQEL
jgi:hypothetical protein